MTSHQLIDIPPLLALTSAPPARLYYRGDRRCVERLSVAVVGSRKASPYGLRTAFQLGRALAGAGVTVVSGLARGIDGAAHAGALAAQGSTVAVLGHGLERIYPAEHNGLAQSILSHRGLLVTEYPASMPPLPANFPRRNRIIAGLCWAVVVIEAAERSGSLITAGFAADEGREVFVVPSRIGEESFRGSHQLIQDGARVLTGVEDVLGVLPGSFSKPTEGYRDTRLSELERVFQKQDGVVRLGDIYASPSLKSALRLALAVGVVVEMEVQKFLWVGGGAAHS